MVSDGELFILNDGQPIVEGMIRKRTNEVSEPISVEVYLEVYIAVLVVSEVV